MEGMCCGLKPSTSKENSLKILHMTHTDVRVDSRILKELTALDAAGEYEIHAIGIAEQGSEASVDFLQTARVNSIRVFFRTVRWLPNSFRYVLVYLEMITRVMSVGLSVRPRLVHCHDTPLLPVAVLLAWICRAKVIYDAHELESEKNGQTALVSRGTYFLEKRLWGAVDGFITVSGSIRQWYESRFTKKDSELILNSPVMDAESLLAVPRSDHYFHHKYDLADGCLVFVYLGLFVSGRGIEKLLNVFAAQDVQAHIVFIGKGPLRTLIEGCARDNPQVHVHDSVPHDQVVSLVRSADYGVCLIERVSLSDYYSLPNKLFEYAFAGVPVLASDFPDLGELVESFSLGVCTPNDEEAITLAVQRLQALEPRRVTADLTSLAWEAQAVHLRSLYQRVLHSATVIAPL